jgi:hypothetical protein
VQPWLRSSRPNDSFTFSSPAKRGYRPVSYSNLPPHTTAYHHPLFQPNKPALLSLMTQDKSQAKAAVHQLERKLASWSSSGGNIASNVQTTKKTGQSAGTGDASSRIVGTNTGRGTVDTEFPAEGNAFLVGELGRPSSLVESTMFAGRFARQLQHKPAPFASAAAVSSSSRVTTKQHSISSPEPTNSPGSPSSPHQRQRFPSSSSSSGSSFDLFPQQQLEDVLLPNMNQSLDSQAMLESVLSRKEQELGAVAHSQRRLQQAPQLPHQAYTSSSPLFRPGSGETQDQDPLSDLLHSHARSVLYNQPNEYQPLSQQQHLRRFQQPHDKHAYASFHQQQLQDQEQISQWQLHQLQQLRSSPDVIGESVPRNSLDPIQALNLQFMAPGVAASDMGRFGTAPLETNVMAQQLQQQPIQQIQQQQLNYHHSEAISLEAKILSQQQQRQQQQIQQIQQQQYQHQQLMQHHDNPQQELQTRLLLRGRPPQQQQQQQQHQDQDQDQKRGAQDGRASK